MGEDDGNPCAFKSICHMSHNVTDETCGYHLVNTVEDCPLHKFAERIQSNFAEEVKEGIDKELEKELVPSRKHNQYAYGLAQAKDIIDECQAQHQGGD